MGDIDIFRDHHARGHVAPVVELVGSRAEYRSQDRFDPLERPRLGKRRVDQRVELALLAHHARDHVAEEGSFRGQIFVAFDLPPDPVTLELRQNVVEARAGKLHLVKRLHGREPGRAPPVGLALLSRLGTASHDAQPVLRRRLSRTRASAARAASPPLSLSSILARVQAWASVSTVRMPFPIGTPRMREISMSPREDSNETISKWMVAPRMTQPS